MHSDGKQKLLVVKGTTKAFGQNRVLKGVDPLLDDEAVRVVAASPDWKAGRKNGKRVASELSVYVEFRLQKKGTFGIKK